MQRLRVVYGGVVFLGAFLLFVVEPMAAKRLLPLLGGSSAVWVTCLVFFQGALLLGYLYAHWMARQRRVWLHAVLLAAAVLVLLLWGSARLAAGSSASEHPFLTIFASLSLTIGLPFMMLSATSPLLQVWWARREGGAVPYRLFALSNAGSLIALLAYPAVVEPYMTLAAQRAWWMAGFAVYAFACGWLGWRAMAYPGHSYAMTTQRANVETAVLEPNSEILDCVPNGDRELSSAETIGAGRRWMWFLLPMAAAMQLAAVTSHLSQDIAAIPLLWILPLATYLLTFIFAFETPGLYRRWVVTRVMVVMLASLGYALSKVDTRLPVALSILFYLLEIFVACWFCHAEVYRLRPASARESTKFYLLVAAGGVAGTFLIGVASPMLFRANYDLAIAFFVTAGLAAVVTWEDGIAPRLLWSITSAGLLALTFAIYVVSGRHALVRVRNFYGSLRVVAADYDNELPNVKNPDGSASTGTGPVRVLMNGRIRHGSQMMDANRRDVPTTYYGTDSGVGVALRNCCEARPKNVGVIGLGVGTIAAYGEPGDRLRFYEINPLVEPIARNLFTYLRDSKAAITIVGGDARMSLSREAPQRFDVLVVDAFTGDAIPLHLLTREAMEVYRRQLAPGGVIAFHVSNSYVDLAPEVGELAEAAGMQASVVQSFDVPAEGAYNATWVLVSDDAAFFAKPAVESVASPVPRKAGLRLWTDDYSSLLPVLKLGWK